MYVYKNFKELSFHMWKKVDEPIKKAPIKTFLWASMFPQM